MGQTVSYASSSASKLLRFVIPHRYVSPLDWGYEKLNNQDDSFHLQIHPQELQFPFELKKQISCSLQLSNKSDNCVAFKFDKESGYKIKECKLRIVYIAPPQPRPSIREESDKDSKVSYEHVDQLDTLFEVHPQELQFPFELRKQISCSLQFSNKSDNYVAFKVKTTNQKRYCVRPNHGVVLPRSTCDVIVTMQAQMETPPDMQCKDKFLIQNVVAKMGATKKDITSEMFNKKSGSKVEECKLKVIYVEPSQPSSTIQGGSDEYFSPRSSVFSDQANAVILKLTEERDNAIEQNKRLEQELELLRSEASKDYHTK
ncbi:vesicle-associated protein 1-2 isoform X3 [Lathyrus oleraceus]|uniref:MSP domain-containing protein n=1 Tax=Pisum sativum TaxID=3888 RepID=A0A9D5A3C5_PEA|nr:vesicle-associated protein 1-2-like isoform X3 [Pisum sativum]KAI5391520.1 hypothetical protein KIW84_076364 [Pisum sativum]